MSRFQLHNAFRFSVDAFIAPPCIDEQEQIGRLGYYWKKAVFARALSTPPAMDPTVFPNTVNVATSSSAGLSHALIQIARVLNETQLTLVGPQPKSGDQYTVTDAINDYLTAIGSSLVKNNIKVDPAFKLLSETMRTVEMSTKIVVIGTDFLDLREALSRIDVRLLSNNFYTVIMVCSGAVEGCLADVSARSLLVNSGIIILAPQMINYTTAVESISSIFPNRKQDKINGYISLYNSCYGYCYSTKILGNEDTQSFATAIKFMSFSNPLGTFQFDGGGNLLHNYSFYIVQSGNGTYDVIMEIITEPSQCISITCFTVAMRIVDSTVLTKKMNEVIEECFKLGNCRNYFGLILGVVLGTMAVFAIIGGYFIKRRHRLNTYRMNWKINKDQLKIIENKQANFKGAKAGDGISGKRRMVTSYALIGSTKAEFIALAHLQKIKWTKIELKYLYEMRQLNHDNLSTFLGICANELDNFYILYALIDRASLEDFIKDPDFPIDDLFRSAFLRDILKGLQYLHKSPIRCHGLLLTKNCLVDSNWVLKLTHFGVASMLHGIINDNLLRSMPEYHLNPDYFPMFAPELLKETRNGDNYPQGTPQGDIYSLGMILYWLIYREDPFGKSGLRGKALIAEILKRRLKPEVNECEGSSEQKALTHLMKECYSTVVESRPSLRNVLAAVNKAYSTSKGNLVDQMLRMNEKYAQNLEQIVAERNAMLQEAQEQTNRLLNEMLPTSVAQVLKEGGSIPPRSYDAATVCFVQLCDFPALVRKSRSDEVISFLNDIFDRFDTIIKNHDAYKVETTGETYMVASGVPNENDGRHVVEIAECSLNIREISYTYVVAHCPEFKIRVRIGFHCGPIAAGVIGIRSPRYCLFGDTVNFASRMQSNCPPNQIQTSEVTAMRLLTTKEYSLVKRGIVQVKGKGEVNCYWLNEHIHDTDHIVRISTPPTTSAIL
ncbi:adenylate/guanylate cyclase catalytic domain protein [Dictyocaulus viviparus]|uniref:guanylate cyclase n=1 Tax=Dictyocaulus viviparus TaxID=29172 RepID=A0A0D8XS64_DICVI|nr:adenylate/guanylate cyclase catalytic domain protein [Dictyocaulus viviparus]